MFDNLAPASRNFKKAQQTIKADIMNERTKFKEMLISNFFPRDPVIGSAYNPIYTIKQTEGMPAKVFGASIILLADFLYHRILAENPSSTRILKITDKMEKQNDIFKSSKYKLYKAYEIVNLNYGRMFKGWRLGVEAYPPFFRIATAKRKNEDTKNEVEDACAGGPKVAFEARIGRFDQPATAPSVELRSKVAAVILA